MYPPTEAVVAFGCQGAEVSRLPSGQSGAWRFGDVVLKRLDMPSAALDWLDATLRPRATKRRLRLALPLRTDQGQLQVSGWTAFPYFVGLHQPGRWWDIADVACNFAAVTAGLRRPAFIDGRSDRWAVADRFAWSEQQLPHVANDPRIRVLVGLRRPVAIVGTVIHGDMAGNVLFDPHEPPALIDLSLYWRPSGYPAAIVAVDAVTYENAPISLLETISADLTFPQYLIRALLFRITTDLLNGCKAETLHAYDAAIEWVQTHA